MVIKYNELYNMYNTIYNKVNSINGDIDGVSNSEWENFKETE